MFDVEKVCREAKEAANKNDVILLNGRDFCSMLIANGLGV